LLLKAVRKAALLGAKTVIVGVESIEELDARYEANIVVSGFKFRESERVSGMVKKLESGQISYVGTEIVLQYSVHLPTGDVHNSPAKGNVRL